MGNFYRLSFRGKLNWAKGIDAQGRPIRTGVQPTAEGMRTCPGFTGATNWYSPSYNPSTHLFYFLAEENCDLFFLKPRSFLKARRITQRERGTARVITGRKSCWPTASNPTNRRGDFLRWVRGILRGGTMTTAGGLLFFGDDAQSFEAVDAQTGKPLWHFNTAKACTLHR